MAKLTLSAIATFVNDVAAKLTYSQNNDLIEAALEKTLSRDGTSPNTMTANLDMNSNKVLNVTTPTAASDAATKGYVDTVATTAGLKGDTGATGVAGPMDGPSSSTDGQLTLFDGTTGKLVKEGVLTTFAKTILAATTAAATRTLLALVPGTNIAGLANAQSFTKGQRGAIVTLTDQTTIATDLDLANNFTVTLGANRTLGNPTNKVAGQGGSIFIVQDGTGSRTLSYGSDWDFPAGVAPTLTTTASAVDRLDYIVRTSGSIHANLATDVK